MRQKTEDRYKLKFKKSLMSLLASLENNAIMRREWEQLVLDDNRHNDEIVQAFAAGKSTQDKLWSLAKIKLQTIVSLMKDFCKAISQEKITQSIVNARFEPLRQEAASAYLPYLSIMVLKFMTEVHIASRDLSEASVTSKGSLLISDLFDESTEMLVSLEIVGNCQRDKRMYKECLATYYKQLFMAWTLNDICREIRAYDNLGMAYFYLNDIEKAHKFHAKAVNAESELETGDAAKKMGERYQNERQRKAQHVGTKDQCYRFKVMKQVIIDRNFFDQEIMMNGVRPMLTNFEVFDESPIRPANISQNTSRLRVVSKNKPQSLAIKQLRDNQFRCNFTKAGLMNSLRKSNPLKLDMIRSGKLRVDSHMLANIDLRDGQQVSSTLLTHQSQNKSADAFMSYHNFVSSSADICLEYVTADIKSVVRRKTLDYVDIITNVRLSLM